MSPVTETAAALKLTDRINRIEPSATIAVENVAASTRAMAAHSLRATSNPEFLEPW